MTHANDDKKTEQKHLDWILQLIQDREKYLKHAIAAAEGEARNLNSHFFDNVKLDYDGYSTSMETALSIHQQQQMLSEREHAWQHSAKQLDTIERLKTRPYFARVDFTESGSEPETIYIGLGSFADENDHFLIYDWRAPISSIYYDGKLGTVSYHAPDGDVTVNMTKKRQFVIEDGKIVDMFDTDESIGDQMLLRALSEKSSTQMKSIVTTIQQEQNKIIRNTSADLLFVQGAAGSGKTSAILQRIAYLLYRYRGNLTSGDVLMFSPNMLFNDYIKSVLPEMGEQNVVQLTYWQYVSRRLPHMRTETLFDQFEHGQKDTAVHRFKTSTAFFNLLERYARHLNKRGLAVKDIKFKHSTKPYFSKDEIRELYYSFNSNYSLANRIEATREELVTRLNHKVNSEAKKSWVREYIEGLSKDQLTALYDRPDQEFKSEDDEYRFLSKRVVMQQLAEVNRRINSNQFLNMQLQYLRFLRAIPKMTKLADWQISEDEWLAEVDRVKANFLQKYIAMDDATPYLYLWDLVTGRQMDYNMRYIFIDEIQDYTPLEIAYLKAAFPHARFTLLGDLNQAIFTKDDSRTLLKQISTLFAHDKVEVVQLTRSYRSTKQITNYTKQILRTGEKIEAFNRDGEKPVEWQCDQPETALKALAKVLERNQQKHYTTAIITKNLAQAEQVYADLQQEGQAASLIKTANQRLVDGNLVLPSYLAKGLEFDAVVMWGADQQNYHALDETQLVYTITSRAMAQLDVIYTGQRSPLLPTDTTTFEENHENSH